MRHLTRSLTALMLSLAATQAFARPQPVPPPSGIVVHLFGPDSLASHILPTAPGSAPASQTGTAAGSAPAASTTSGPSWGDVAHQMFVTGDPAQEGAAALPKGKAGQ